MEADLTRRSRELEAENRVLRRKNERLEKKLAASEKKIRELTRKLAELSRAGKRQAAPFARRIRKAQRRRPGRAAGHKGAFQAVPDNIDENVRAPLERCPCCGGKDLGTVRDHEQYVIDIPQVQQHVRRIVTQSGYCRRCRKRVRSTHPDQVSTGYGAAKVALGPRVLGLAADLKHRYGMAYRDTADLLATYFGVRVTHSAFVHASVRLARRGQATYTALVERVQSSPVVHTDDTGWRIDTDAAWLWVFATAEVTVYVIARSRGAGVVTNVLGQDFTGRLVSDGLPALDALDYRRAQCLGHLLRRASEMAATQVRGAARFPLQVKGLLQDVFALRARRDELAASTYAQYRRGLETRLDRLLAGRSTVPDNERLRRHMRKHRDQLLVCLYEPAVEPTNNLAERELRGAVVVRKLGGCHRSDVHADAHAVLASVAQTAHRNGVAFTDVVFSWVMPRAGPLDVPPVFVSRTSSTA